MSQSEQDKRAKDGISSGVIGLVTNVFLVIIKFIAGLTANSVSILADAMNSVGDSLSALLTIIGFYIAKKPADKEHPFGHQRAEYISGLFTAIIILFVGFQFLLVSIEKIIQPTSVEQSTLVLNLLVLSILTKAGLAYYYYKKNKNISAKSNVIRALMKDSLYDMIINLVIIVSYFVEITYGWYIDGYIGLLVSFIILHGGTSIILESSNDLLGTRPSPKLVQKMQDVLDSYEDIIGYHDLMLHKYGPNNMFATVDIEVDSRWDLIEAHNIIDTIEREFKNEFDVVLVCHLDPVVLYDEEQNEIYRVVKQTLKSYNQDFYFHDFRVEEHEDYKEVFFDVVVPDTYEASDEVLYERINTDIHQKLEDSLKLSIEFDRNYVLMP